jgi:hypothetical protein
MIAIPSTSRARAGTVEDKFPLPSWTTRSRASSDGEQMLDRVATLGNALGQPRVNLRSNARQRQLGRSRHIEPVIGVGSRRMACEADIAGGAAHALASWAFTDTP